MSNPKLSENNSWRQSTPLNCSILIWLIEEIFPYIFFGRKIVDQRVHILLSIKRRCALRCRVRTLIVVVLLLLLLLLLLRRCGVVAHSWTRARNILLTAIRCRIARLLTTVRCRLSGCIWLVRRPHHWHERSRRSRKRQSRRHSHKRGSAHRGSRTEGWGNPTEHRRWRWERHARTNHTTRWIFILLLRPSSASASASLLHGLVATGTLRPIGHIEGRGKRGV